jgi:Cdc6-like AAA superfamily ATPase
MGVQAAILTESNISETLGWRRGCSKFFSITRRPLISAAPAFRSSESSTLSLLSVTSQPRKMTTPTPKDGLDITQTLGSVYRNHGIVTASFTGNQYIYNETSTHAKSRFDPESVIDKVLRSDPDLTRKHLRTTKGDIVNGTCEWIMNNEDFKSWEENGILLRITGGPGQGKTMLSIFLTKRLKQKQLQLQQNKAREVVFFFCTNNDDAVSILRGLIYQLLREQPQLVRFIAPYLEHENQSKLVLFSYEALWSRFLDMLQDAELATVCIIDGIDECDNDSVRNTNVQV